eukprot:15458809-Alexandrium_andersonii.AAC.1
MRQQAGCPGRRREAPTGVGQRPPAPRQEQLGPPTGLAESPGRQTQEGWPAPRAQRVGVPAGRPTPSAVGGSPPREHLAAPTGERDRAVGCRSARHGWPHAPPL